VHVGRVESRVCLRSLAERSTDMDGREKENGVSSRPSDTDSGHHCGGAAWDNSSPAKVVSEIRDTPPSPRVSPQPGRV